MSRERSATATVEDALCLDIAELRALGLFDDDVHVGYFEWRSPWSLDTPAASVGFELSRDAEGYFTAIDLNYFAIDFGKSIEQNIPIVRTRPGFGGQRKWFACPECGRRTRSLLLPSFAQIFACRLCHKLTYRSSRTGHRRAA